MRFLLLLCLLVSLCTTARAGSVTCTTGLTSCSSANATQILVKGAVFVPFGARLSIPAEVTTKYAGNNAGLTTWVNDEITEMAFKGLNLAVMFNIPTAIIQGVLDHAQTVTVNSVPFQVMFKFDDDAQAASYAAACLNEPSCFGYDICEDCNADGQDGCAIANGSSTDDNGNELKAAIIAGGDDRHIYYMSPEMRSSTALLERNASDTTAMTLACGEMGAYQKFPVRSDAQGGNTPLYEVYTQGKIARSYSNTNSKAFVGNLQTFASGYPDSSGFPTIWERRAMMWASIAAGAQGTVWTAWYGSGVSQDIRNACFAAGSTTDVWSTFDELAAEHQSMAGYIANASSATEVLNDGNLLIASKINVAGNAADHIVIVLNFDTAQRDFSIPITGSSGVQYRVVVAGRYTAPYTSVGQNDVLKGRIGPGDAIVLRTGECS